MNKVKIATTLCALSIIATGCANTSQNSVVAETCAEILPIYENWDGQNPAPSAIIATSDRLISKLVNEGFTYEDDIAMVIADIRSYHSDAVALGLIRGDQDDYVDRLKQACK